LTTVLDEALADPVPAALVAVTVTAYVTPFVRVEMVQDVAPVVVQVRVV
jgi:hypothetical protein